MSGKSDENNPWKTNQSAPSIYIMIEICYFSLDQWEIRIHLISGKCFNIPHDCHPHVDQTKFNGLLHLTIHGVLVCHMVTCFKLVNLILWQGGKACALVVKKIQEISDLQMPLYLNDRWMGGLCFLCLSKMIYTLEVDIAIEMIQCLLSQCRYN